MKKTYEEFKEEVMNCISGYLPEEYQKGKVIGERVMKNNVAYDALVILKPGQRIAPNVYVEDVYKWYLSLPTEVPFAFVLESIAQYRIRTDICEASVPDISWVRDFEKVKPLLRPRIIQVKSNEELLQGRPFVPLADLAVTFVIDITQTMGGVTECAQIPVKNDLYNLWKGVDEITLYESAVQGITSFSIENTASQLLTFPEEELAEYFGCSIECVREMKEEIARYESSVLLYTFTSGKGTNGSEVILSQEAMKEVKERFGKHFILIPSSIHEWLILPYSEDEYDIAAIKQMVSEVNVASVPLEEQLSDSVYTYDFEHMTLVKLY